MNTKVAQLRSVTGLGDRAARELLTAYDGRVDAAADGFFSGDWQDGRGEEDDMDEEGREIDDETLDDFFDRYADAGTDAITDEGIERFCADIALDTQDLMVLVLCWQMKAKEMCVITREEWRTGMRAIGADSAVSVREALPRLKDKVADPNNDAFRQLYAYCYEFAREDAKKSISVDDALSLWDILLVGKRVPLLGEFTAYVRQQAAAAAAAATAAAAGATPGAAATAAAVLATGAARVTKDMWSQVLDFLLLPDLSHYSAEDAWPVVIDDFVSQRGSGAPGSGGSGGAGQRR